MTTFRPALLTVYYDASCPLCATEMAALKSRDTDDLLRLVDCSSPGFDAGGCEVAGIDRRAMLSALHARDVLGEWHVGVDAVAAVYGVLGCTVAARTWSHPWLRPVATRLYAWIARHRHGLPRLRPA